MEVNGNNVINAQWSQIAGGTFSLDTVTHLAVNLLLSPQEPPLKLHLGLHYAAVFLQAGFALRQQDPQTLQGCGADSALLSRDLRVLNYNAVTSKHDPPLASLTAQPALIPYHVLPTGVTVNKPSALLPPNTSFLTEREDSR